MSKIFYVVPIMLCVAGNAWAGAWLQPEGQGQMITTLTHYATDGSFNANGNRVGQTGHYSKYEADMYLEYGLTENYTIGIQPNYQWDKNAGKTNDDLGDTALFVRRHIWNNDYNVVSVQGLVTVPGPYNKHDQPAPGYGQTDLELRGLYGHSGDIAGVSYFTDLEGAYRERFDGPADEIHVDGTFGLKPIKGLMLLGQSFNTISLNNASTHIFVAPNAPNYDLYTLEFSGVIDMPKGFSLQLGTAVDVAGRNTGQGVSELISIWRKF